MSSAPSSSSLLMYSDSFESMMEALQFMQLQEGFYTAADVSSLAAPGFHGFPLSRHSTLLGPETFDTSGTASHFGPHHPPGNRPGVARGQQPRQNNVRRESVSSGTSRGGAPRRPRTFFSKSIYSGKKDVHDEGSHEDKDAKHGTTSHGKDNTKKLGGTHNPGPAGDHEHKKLGEYSTACGGGSIVVETVSPGHVECRIVYTREFMLQASASPFCVLPHDDVPHLAFAHPEILRPIPGKFRSNDYKTFCLLTKILRNSRDDAAARSRKDTI